MHVRKYFDCCFHVLNRKGSLTDGSQVDVSVGDDVMKRVPWSRFIESAFHFCENLLV